MIQDNPIVRFIGHGISAMTSIGDSPLDSEEDKLAHHHLIYMGVLMSCGGVVWGAIAVFYGLYVHGLPAVLHIFQVARAQTRLPI